MAIKTVVMIASRLLRRLLLLALMFGGPAVGQLPDAARVAAAEIAPVATKADVRRPADSARVRVFDRVVAVGIPRADAPPFGRERVVDFGRSYLRHRRLLL